MSTLTDWIQTGLLIVNAGLIAWYLRETIKLRRAAEKQVRVGQEELEGHTKPALIARLSEQSFPLVELVNIGSGPALHLEFMTVPRRSTTKELISGVGFDRVAYLESQQIRTIHVRTHGQEIVGNNSYLLDSSSRSLRCEYRSLSGRVYFSVFDFDHTGNFVEDTHFGECEPRRN